MEFYYCQLLTADIDVNNEEEVEKYCDQLTNKLNEEVLKRGWNSFLEDALDDDGKVNIEYLSRYYGNGETMRLVNFINNYLNEDNFNLDDYIAWDILARSEDLVNIYYDVLGLDDSDDGIVIVDEEETLNQCLFEHGFEAGDIILAVDLTDFFYFVKVVKEK